MDPDQTQHFVGHNLGPRALKYENLNLLLVNSKGGLENFVGKLYFCL